jgi:hypothetical protein
LFVAVVEVHAGAAVGPHRLPARASVVRNFQRGSYELEKQELDRAATDGRTALGCTNGATHYKVRTTWSLIVWRLARRDLHDPTSGSRRRR